MKFSLQWSRLSNLWILLLVILNVYMVSVVTAAEIPSARMERSAGDLRNVREAAVGNEMEVSNTEFTFAIWERFLF